MHVFFTEIAILEYPKWGKIIKAVSIYTKCKLAITLSTIAWIIYPLDKQHISSIYTLYEYHLSLFALRVNMMLFVSVYTHAHGIHHHSKDIGS